MSRYDDLMRERETQGLLGAVNNRLDEIDRITESFGYAQHKYVQELLAELYALIFTEVKGGSDET